MKLINIGYGNTVNSDRVIAAVSADAAPVKRIISAAKDNNTAIDATLSLIHISEPTRPY